MSGKTEKSNGSCPRATNTSDSLSIVTASEKETIEVGRAAGKLLCPGAVVALVGELGSGKTRFIKGLAEGAGVKDSRQVVSPTYTLINEYAGKVPFYHIDAYRLSSAKELIELGVEEYLDSDGVTVIEWADRVGGVLPESYLRVTMVHVSDKRRQIIIENHNLPPGFMKKLKSAVKE